jgi:glycosyltransferase involved in cell wall biosynthesis
MAASSKPKLSLAMIVKNEARCLGRCLRSVAPIVDEVVVADTGSTDDTVKIAREFGAAIASFQWIGDFAAARNFAIRQTAGDWVLVLDADEWASESLASEILAFVGGAPAIGRLKIVSDFRRREQIFRSQSYVPRLFPRGARFEGRIHEQLVSSLPRQSLRGELWHDGYLEIQKADRNIELLATELERDPDNVYFLFQLATEYTSLDQPKKAFEPLQKAFALMKPGNPSAPNIATDLLYTIMALKKFECGIELIATAGKYPGDYPDFFLARGLFYMNLVRSDPAKYAAELPKIEQSFQRCLELGEEEKRKSVRGSGTFLASYNLGLFYHVFGNKAAAARCLQASAAQGYKPAAELLLKF